MVVISVVFFTLRRRISLFLIAFINSAVTHGLIFFYFDRIFTLEDSDFIKSLNVLIKHSVVLLASVYSSVELRAFFVIKMYSIE